MMLAELENGTLEWQLVPGYKGQGKYSNLCDWDKLDWSRNDQDIARELKVEPAVIRNVRKKLGKQRAPRRDYRLKATEEMLAAVDWKNLRDAEISRLLRVSRERVRQIRIHRGEPCERETMKSKIPSAIKWLQEHRAEMEGKSWREIISLIPIEMAPSTKRVVLRMSGIKYLRENIGDIAKLPVNWELPNGYLVMIWGLTQQAWSNHRRNYDKGDAKWCAMGYSNKYAKDPEFLEAVSKEIDKARTTGREVDEDAIWSLVERKQLAAELRELL